MYSQVGTRLACLAACLVLCCAGPQSVGSTRLPGETGIPLQSRPPVRVQLFDCETVEPVAFEEALPDGRLFEPIGNRGSQKIRLYLRLENLTDRPVRVSTCNGALTIVPENTPTPFCGSADWLSLPASASAPVYPMIERPMAANGIFVERLLPYLGHAPDPSWLAYTPNPVAFELTPTGCRPIDATQAPPLARTAR
jgi:hypothetical protein